MRRDEGFKLSGRSAQHGFTLIEMMVALMIFAMLATAGVSLLGFSVRAQAAATARLDSVAADQRMASLIAADLAQALPRIFRDTSGARQPAFAGTNGIGDAPLLRYTRGGLGNGLETTRAAIQRVELTLVSGRLERRAYAMVDGTVAGPPMPLARDIETIRLRYRDKGLWAGTWDDPRPAALPQAIEMIVKRRGRPALMMAFMVGTGA